MVPADRSFIMNEARSWIGVARPIVRDCCPVNVNGERRISGRQEPDQEQAGQCAASCAREPTKRCIMLAVSNGGHAPFNRGGEGGV